MISAAALSFACLVPEDLGRRGDAGIAPAEAGIGSDAGADAATDAPPNPGRRRMFVTTGQFTGNLKAAGGAADGVAGGDAICNREAGEAGLPGTFRAWLSTSTLAAKDHVAARGPWFLVDGTESFSGASPVDGPRWFPNVTAQGKVLFNFDEAWTGTASNGLRSPDGSGCKDWASDAAADLGGVGSISSSSEWTAKVIAPTTKACNLSAHIYCFEQ
jgi:hypothetical protein